MEFWGVEVKPGCPLKVEQEDGYIIHISQISLGESMKVKDEIVPVFINVGDDKTKLVLGNLSEKIPQFSLDLWIEQEFEISHNCESSSVFLLGYKTPDAMDEQYSDFDSEEGIPMDLGLEKSNVNEQNDQKAIPEAAESDSDEEDKHDSESDEMDDDDDDSDDSDDSEEEEEDETPLKIEPDQSKKRPNDEAMNNTVASKKQKVTIPAEEEE